MSERDPEPSAQTGRRAEISHEVLTSEPTTVRVRLAGELDLASLQELEPEVDDVLRPAPSRLIVDVAEVTFADSSAITLWVGWAAAVDHFQLHRPPAVLRAVLIRMGLGATLGLDP